MPRQLLTPEQVAEILALPSVETLYAWRRRRHRTGGIPYGPPALLVGKHLRYPADKLEAWINQRLSVVA